MLDIGTQGLLIVLNKCSTTKQLLDLKIKTIIIIIDIICLVYITPVCAWSCAEARGGCQCTLLLLAWVLKQGHFLNLELGWRPAVPRTASLSITTWDTGVCCYVGSEIQTQHVPVNHCAVTLPPECCCLLSYHAQLPLGFLDRVSLRYLGWLKFVLPALALIIGITGICHHAWCSEAIVQRQKTGRW